MPVPLRLRFALEILGDYLRVRRLLRRGDVRIVLDAIRTLEADSCPPVTANRLGRRLARPVQRTLGPLPWDSRCLTQSLVVIAMMARRGIRCDLCLGTTGGGSFAAHAWAEHQGRPILPTLDYPLLTRL